MTTRENILAQIKTTLEAVVGMTEVQVNRTIPVDIETVGFPCAFVYSGKETRLTDDRAVIGKENWEWEILIEVWGRDEDMEALLGLVHTAMYNDYSIGGHAEYSYRTGVDMLTIDPERSLEAMLLTYSVIYRHTKGVM